MGGVRTLALRAKPGHDGWLETASTSAKNSSGRREFEVNKKEKYQFYQLLIKYFQKYLYLLHFYLDWTYREQYNSEL